jgi:putative transcription factor
LSKRAASDLDKECPICGSIIWGKGEKVLIEGAKIKVCQNCAKNGIKIIKPKAPKEVESLHKKLAINHHPLPKRVIEPLDEYEIIEDYNIKIKNFRESKGLNQDKFAQKINEKPSLLKRIESGKGKPTIKLARKMEHIYGLNLIKKVEQIDSSPQTTKYLKKSQGSSLGDIAFIKKKKSEDT